MSGYSDSLLAMLISFFTIMGLYVLGRRGFRKEGDKSESYACGEKMPATNPVLSIIFFKYAFAFLVLDIVAMIIAFSLGVKFSPISFGVLLTYAFCMLLSILMIFSGE